MNEVRKRNREIRQKPRVDYAIRKIRECGYDVEKVSDSTIRFQYNGSPVTVFPYTGWFTGKSVKDGRGINNLLKQIS